MTLLTTTSWDENINCLILIYLHFICNAIKYQLKHTLQKTNKSLFYLLIKKPYDKKKTLLTLIISFQKARVSCRDTSCNYGVFTSVQDALLSRYEARRSKQGKRGKLRNFPQGTACRGVYHNLLAKLQRTHLPT